MSATAKMGDQRFRTMWYKIRPGADDLTIPDFDTRNQLVSPSLHLSTNRDRMPAAHACRPKRSCEAPAAFLRSWLRAS